MGGKMLDSTTFICAILCVYFLPGTTTAYFSWIGSGFYEIQVFRENESEFGLELPWLVRMDGNLYTAKPLDACSPLSNRPFQNHQWNFPAALIVRGGCPLDVKVKNAQEAGFQVAVVLGNEDHGELIAMTRSSIMHRIHSVFVGKVSDEFLKKYANVEPDGARIVILLNILPPLIVVFVYVMVLLAVVWVFCFIYKLLCDNCELVARLQIMISGVEGNSMLGALPIEKFNVDLEENSTSLTCAICCADYELGDKLRVLPCRHKFHSKCVDEWLTKWKSFCPVCKLDLQFRKNKSVRPASGFTPLLSNRPSISYASFRI